MGAGVLFNDKEKILTVIKVFIDFAGIILWLIRSRDLRQDHTWFVSALIFLDLKLFCRMTVGK